MLAIWPVGAAGVRSLGRIRIMNVDVADGLLLDVRDTSFAELRFDDESGLDRALERILASSTECTFNSFSSAI
jgi:hypothetical protein